MIEVVSYPADLAQWNPMETPFYLELFGETSPQLDTRYAEVIKPGPEDSTAQTVAAAPIYEYWWTIGHPGHAPETRHFWDIAWGEESKSIWERLKPQDGIAARVYLFFPRSGGWRIKELAATAKYLTPYKEQHTWEEAIAQGWKNLQSPVSTAAGLAAAAAGGPLAGMAVKGGVADAGKLLGALAKLQINNVPRIEGFEWSVSKVTFGSKLGVMQGVMWALPKEMFTQLGGRLTGSLALSLIPAPIQQGGQIAKDLPRFEALPILAHSVVYTDAGEIWAPSQRDFVKLHLHPTVASSQAAS